MLKKTFISPPRLIPNKSTIAVISPSRSLSIIDKSVQVISQKTLSDCGFDVRIDNENYETNQFASASMESKLMLIHKLIIDSKVDALLSSIGGFNSNSIIEHLDYQLIKNNPKVWCGFSDVTTLLNAITVSTGLITYYGPHFSTFGMLKNSEYTVDSFIIMTTTKKPLTIQSSKWWSDDEWYLGQKNRKIKKNSGYFILQKGRVKGLLFGGHLSTYGLLRGTKWYPQLKDTILFVETDQDNPSFATAEFDRELESILQNQQNRIKGLIIGRFPEKSKVTESILRQVIGSKKELDNIPIIANFDIGHTSPITTLPIGGTVEIDTSNKDQPCKIINH